MRGSVSYWQARDVKKFVHLMCLWLLGTSGVLFQKLSKIKVDVSLLHTSFEKTLIKISFWFLRSFLDVCLLHIYVFSKNLFGTKEASLFAENYEN